MRLLLLLEKLTIKGSVVRYKVFKHIKPNHQLQREGSIEKKEAPIHISNVMLFNPSTGKGDRVGFKIENGEKFRVYKSTGARVD